MASPAPCTRPSAACSRPRRRSGWGSRCRSTRSAPRARRRLGHARRQATARAAAAEAPARARSPMKLSISQITTVAQSFADDLDAYRAAGADGIGIWETKLADDSLQRFRESGLEAAAAVPAVPSILPLPLMPGPDDPAERVEAICAGIERLAPVDPA